MAFKKATLQNAAVATGNGGTVETEGMSIVGLQVTGTFVATVNFEATINDIDWFALQGMNLADGSLASTTTATGAWVCSVAGLSRVRARVGPYTNGTVTVMALASENGSLSLNDISVTSAAAVTQGTSPWVVSGSVTANAGTNLSTSLLATESTLIDFISAFQVAMAGGVTVNSGFNIDTSTLALEAGNLAAIKAAIEILDDVVSGNEAQVDVLTLPSIAQLPAALGAGGGLKVDGSGTPLPVSGTATVTQGAPNAGGAQAWPVQGAAADDAAPVGNPLPIAALADDTNPDSVDEGDIGLIRMTLSRLLRFNDSREAGTTAAHRTITALDGRYPPLPTDAAWAANPGQRSQARYFTDIVVRGTTALADDPVVRFRTYVRNGGSGGYVGAGEYVDFTRPRLQDLTSIKFQKTTDNGASYTDYSAAVIDNSGATQADLDALDTAANGDWFIIGGPIPFIGAALDMDAANVNSNASVLTVEYWNGAAWVALANVTDGTILVAGKTLSGDGQITWDMPAAGAWAASTINAITAYWVRCSVSAVLSANVDVEECDLLTPIQAAVDSQINGDDGMLRLSEQTASVTGTVAYSGTIRVSFR